MWGIFTEGYWVEFKEVKIDWVLKVHLKKKNNTKS